MIKVCYRKEYEDEKLKSERIVIIYNAGIYCNSLDLSLSEAEELVRLIEKKLPAC